MSINKQCRLSLQWSAWLVLVQGAVIFGSSNADADFIPLPQAAWSYSQINSPGRLLDDENFGGRINPMSFPDYSEDKTIPYAPGSFYPFYEGGHTQTSVSTIFAGGLFPSIESRGATLFNNVPGQQFAQIDAHMEYDFQAWKKYEWAPNEEVPLAALMAVSANAYGGDGTKAYASASIAAGSFSAEVSIFTDLEGNGSKQLSSKFLTRIDTANKAFLSTSILLGNSNAVNEPSGNWGGGAIADPFIQIDPDAFVEVEGVSYRATDLYGIAFSPGFSTVPEPSGMLYLSFLLLSHIAGSLLKKCYFVIRSVCGGAGVPPVLAG